MERPPQLSELFNAILQIRSPASAIIHDPSNGGQVVRNQMNIVNSQLK